MKIPLCLWSVRDAKNLVNSDEALVTHYFSRYIQYVVFEDVSERYIVSPLLFFCI